MRPNQTWVHHRSMWWGHANADATRPSTILVVALCAAARTP